MEQYTAIKRRLREAERMIDEGKVAEADAYIRATEGVTAHDIAVCMGKARVRKLRAYARKARA